MMVTTTLPDLAIRSERHEQSVLAPTVDYMVSWRPEFKTHLHCVAEAGSHQAIQFAKAYQFKTEDKLPVSSLCLDSTPGDHQYHRIARAFQLSLPGNLPPPNPRSHLRLSRAGLLGRLWPRERRHDADQKRTAG